MAAEDATAKKKLAWRASSLACLEWLDLVKGVGDEDVRFRHTT